MSRIRRIKAFAKIELGLDSEEFYNMTPAELAYYVNAWEARERRADAYSALISSILTNINRDSKKYKKPFDLEEFLMFFPIPDKKCKDESSDLTSYIMSSGIKVEEKNGEERR